ncbi:MAG: hypothetical protein CMP25_02515 [Rickettsiales bacterium]|nr:hypothetical protein [Rickettsiales bacterium]
MNYKNVGIIGSGSWGIALSIALNFSKCNVTVFVNSNKSYDDLKQGKSRFLPSQPLPKGIKLTTKIYDLKDSSLIFVVTPSQMVRKNLLMVSKNINFKKTFILCSKGIENRSNKLMTEVFFEIYPDSEPVVLSGPNFSDEVSKNLPTAFVLSCADKKIVKEIGNVISNKNFRPYFNNDIIGTQIGGSMKNIIAIACGIVIGKKLGENAKSSIMTRGLKEMIKLGTSLGAEEKTFMGLSGLGDLNLSCNSIKSRNMLLGYELGCGVKLKDINKKKKLNEGVASCSAICELAKIKKIELPICSAVKEILDGGSISNVIYNLLSRPLQFET